MPSLKENYLNFKQRIYDLALRFGRNPHAISLLPVTKTQPIEKILEIYKCDCFQFGENRVNELLAKQSQLPSDIDWHLIGTLQSNKIPKILGKVALIHSVDNIELAQKLSKGSLERNLTTPILLQVNTSGELTKHGWSVDGCLKDYERLLALSNIEIQGLMTMAPARSNEILARSCFASLRILKEKLVERGGKALPVLSMGMSGDYPWAIAEGATLIRIGTALFDLN